METFKKWKQRKQKEYQIKQNIEYEIFMQEIHPSKDEKWILKLKRYLAKNNKK